MDIAAQIDLERLFHKNQLLPRMRREFMTPEFMSYCEDQGIHFPFALDLLAQIALHKRANVETLVGILHRHFEEFKDPYQACADALWAAVERDLVDFDTFSEQFIFRYDVSDEVKLELERFQYPLPFVVEPKPVHSNEDTGYFTSKGSIILKQNHHTDDVCLDHINRVNRMKLRINPDTARMVKNQWRNLDRPKQGETQAEFEKRCKAFEKYDRVSREVMETICMTDDQAGFWLTHRYDKRGRTYAQGHHVQYQGTPWNKAVVEFFDQEVVK